jgi:hypothetical protein
MTISSAIGDFTIGISQIGDPPFDWQQTVLSQFSSSPNLLAYLSLLEQNLDVTAAVENFYDQVWNVYTAEGWGLDFWGQIVGIPNGRTLAVTSQYFGFQEADDIDELGWNQAAWYSGAPLTSNVELSDAAFLQLILAKAAANITDCSIPAINAILRDLFGASGICYCTDGQDMTMTYTFEFALSPMQISIVETAGVLPRPTGVSASIVQS